MLELRDLESIGDEKRPSEVVNAKSVVIKSKYNANVDVISVARTVLISYIRR